jgi:hypothetical protein
MGHKAQIKERMESNGQKNAFIKAEVLYRHCNKMDSRFTALTFSSVGHPWIRGSIPGEGKRLFVPHNVQAGSEAHSAS